MRQRSDGKWEWPERTVSSGPRNGDWEHPYITGLRLPYPCELFPPTKRLRSKPLTKEQRKIRLKMLKDHREYLAQYPPYQPKNPQLCREEREQRDRLGKSGDGNYGSFKHKLQSNFDPQLTKWFTPEEVAYARETWLSLHEKELDSADRGRSNRVVYYGEFYDSLQDESQQIDLNDGWKDERPLEADEFSQQTSALDELIKKNGETFFQDVALAKALPKSELSFWMVNAEDRIDFSVLTEVLNVMLDFNVMEVLSDQSGSIDEKIATHLRKKWRRRNWKRRDTVTMKVPYPGTGKVVLERLRIFLDAQQKAHRQLTEAEVATLPLPPLPGPPVERDFGMLRLVENDVTEKFRTLTEHQVRSARERLQDLYLVPVWPSIEGRQLLRG